eukprot:8408002-Lingulodinium_polyedra.AAC.1
MEKGSFCIRGVCRTYHSTLKGGPFYVRVLCGTGRSILGGCRTVRSAQECYVEQTVLCQRESRTARPTLEHHVDRHVQ